MGRAQIRVEEGSDIEAPVTLARDIPESMQIGRIGTLSLRQPIGLDEVKPDRMSDPDNVDVESNA